MVNNIEKFVIGVILKKERNRRYFTNMRNKISILPRIYDA